MSATTSAEHGAKSANPSGDALLRRVYDFIGRFVAYPSEHAHVAHALWIVHCHFMDRWETTPRLAFLSPEPASGKSRALEVTAPLVPRAVIAVTASPAYLFRKVASPDGLPTILYDEIDTIFGPKARENEETRGLLNAGHRKGAIAGRCVVRGKEVFTEEFPAFAAVALAGLGRLPDTILTRSVVIRMRPRAPNERVESFRARIHEPEGREIGKDLALWAGNVTDNIKWPEIPEVQDRDADVWEALLVVADFAGSDWPERAREAAKAMVGESKDNTPSLGVRLLADLRVVFGEADVVPTETILEQLHNIEESPWADLRGKPLDARGLSTLLRQYGIKPGNVYVRERTSPKGYKRADLVDAWNRYVSAPAVGAAATPASAAISDTENMARVADVADLPEGHWKDEAKSGPP